MAGAARRGGRGPGRSKGIPGLFRATSVSKADELVSVGHLQAPARLTQSRRYQLQGSRTAAIVLLTNP